MKADKEIHDYNVKVNVDTSDIDIAQEKADKFYKTLEKASKLLNPLASKTTN